MPPSEISERDEELTVTPGMVSAGIGVLLEYCPDTAVGDGVDRRMVKRIYLAMAECQAKDRAVP
jgi:hypothetical protein